MRVSDNYRFEFFKASVQALKGKLDRNQEKISSQKEILAPSDDPVGTAQYIQLQTQQDKNTQYVKNLERLTTLSGMYETSINSVSDVLTAAKQLAVTMSSDTVTKENRAAAVSEVEGMIEQLASLGNTKVGGTYIFGGKKTDTAPYAVNTTVDPSDGNYYSVSFSGTSDVPSVNISSGQTEKLGMSGDTVFGSGASSIFTALKGLRDGLASNNTTAIKNSMTTIDAGVDLTANNLSSIGAFTQKISNLSQVTTDNTTQLKTTASKIMDVDMISALTDYNLLTTAYETALSVMGKMQAMNILNYIK